MTTLHAQPYDLAACGFYFDSAAEFASKSANLRNAYGQPVEEFEIQFIDGETLDAQLFDALSINQVNAGIFLDAIADWSDEQKIKLIIAVGEAGYSFDLGRDDPDQFEVDLYQCDSLRDMAIQFVEEGLFGDIPASIQNYLDYDALARDLAMDYGTVTVGGVRYVWRCG